MLILSRQRNETIVVDVPPCKGHRRICFTVVDIRGDKVRLGTEAPKDVSINRLEVQKIKDKAAGGK